MHPLFFDERKEADIAFIKDLESKSIRQRRKTLKLREGDPHKDAIGLALSGGGIRSATFNLGLLQALEDRGFLKWIDYMSTVSGGGYIGSSLSWFMANNGGRFPFGKSCSDESSNKPLSWLRLHSSYLTPGKGLDIWALFAAIVRGVFINLLVTIPILFGLLYFLTWDVFFDLNRLMAAAGIHVFPHQPRSDAFQWSFLFGISVLCLLLLYVFLYSVLSKVLPVRFDKNRVFSAQYGGMLKMGVACTLLGMVPMIDHALTTELLNEWRATIVSSLSLTGVISLVSGWMGLKGKDETRGIRAYLIRIGLVFIVVAIILVMHRLAINAHDDPKRLVFGILIPVYSMVIGSVIVSVAIGLLSDINHVSMHRYYRDRLLEAYMPTFESGGASFLAADDFYLPRIEIEKTGAPYQIVNANITTTGSEDPKLKARGGANFIFSPLFVGSDATGYRKTEDYIGGKLSLATAFAISGAAVDPNTGATRSRPLAFLMTLMNVRLGYWLINPNRMIPQKYNKFVPSGLKKKGSYVVPAPPFWHTYAFREMLGLGLHEHNSYVHVSDGGHFENLGVYELVRRKCPYIIISDASEDAEWTFKELARACELVRVDFCAEVSIDTRPMHPNKESGYSESAFVLGELKYPTGESSKVIYLNTAMIKEGLPEDLHGYKRAHNRFPDESTADQFFDETQFEAYRELGYCLGKAILRNWRSNSTSPKDVFKAVATKLKAQGRPNRKG
jgi:hypothetical protein